MAVAKTPEEATKEAVERLESELEVSKEQMVHAWPPLGEHLWGKWQNKTGLPKATQYRTCVHPLCNEVQEREAPKA